MSICICTHTYNIIEPNARGSVCLQTPDLQLEIFDSKPEQWCRYWGLKEAAISTAGGPTHVASGAQTLWVRKPHNLAMVLVGDLRNLSAPR